MSLDLFRGHGAKPDRHDDRDFSKQYSRAEVTSAPYVSLQSCVDHIYDQGQLDSCTANALCAAYGIDLKKQSGYQYFNPSRLFTFVSMKAPLVLTQEPPYVTPSKL